MIDSKSLVSLSVAKFSEKGHYEKVTSFESLVSRISNTSNINDMLNLVSQNILVLKNDHIVLSLRVLARILRNAQKNEVNNLGTDERYIKLTARAKEGIEQFNEYGNNLFSIDIDN